MAEGSLEVIGDASRAAEHLGVVGLVALEDAALLVKGVDGLAVHARLLHLIQIKNITWG